MNCECQTRLAAVYKLRTRHREISMRFPMPFAPELQHAREFLVLPVLLLSLAACGIGAPFEGPGFEEGVTDAEGPLLVVATHTRIARGESRSFNDHVDAITAQLDTQPGHVGHALRTRVPGRERWTVTVWEDEASMMDFVVQGAHLEAMGDSAIDGVYSAHWMVEPEDLPVPWSEVLDQLDAVAPENPW